MVSSGNDGPGSVRSFGLAALVAGLPLWRPPTVPEWWHTEQLVCTPEAQGRPRWETRGAFGHRLHVESVF